MTATFPRSGSLWGWMWGTAAGPRPDRGTLPAAAVAASGRLKQRRVAPVGATALFVVVVLAAGLVGCGSRPAPVSSPADPVNITVYLWDDVTGPQKQAIEAKLRALPGAAGVTFQTGEQIYQRMKEAFKDHPNLFELTGPEDLPASFEARLASRAAAEPSLAELRRLPGVDQVDVPPPPPPTSKPAPASSRPDPMNIPVTVRDDATGSQKRAIEAKLRALPGAAGVTFQTREQAYQRFKEAFKDDPGLVAGARLADFDESFEVRLASLAAAEADLAELRQVPGVERVGLPWLPTPSPTR